MRNGAVAGHAERALVRMGFQPGDELLEVPDLGRDGRADEKHNANHERIDRNEVLGCRKSKSGILIGSGTGRNAQRSAESRPGIRVFITSDVPRRA